MYTHTYMYILVAASGAGDREVGMEILVDSFLIFLIFFGIVVKILFQKSGVFDETFHLVRPFCLTMKISLILEGLKF